MIRNGLVRLDKFAPSQRPYAFRPETFAYSRGYATVEAIWPGRKSGKTTASFGTIGGCHESYEDLVENVDMRYGGLSMAKWNGVALITDCARPKQWCDEMVDMLDAVLQAFPAVPEGYEGWFYRR